MKTDHITGQSRTWTGDTPPSRRCLWPSLLATTAAMGLLTSCGHGPSATQADADDIVATVGETPIPSEAFLREWNRHAGKSSGRFAAADPQAVLDRLIRRELLFAEATRTGFDQSPEIRTAWRDFVINRFAEQQQTSWEELPPPTEQAIAAFREEHPDRFALPERARVAMIYFTLSPFAAADRAEALAKRVAAVREQALREAGTSPDFGRLALEHSEHRASRHIGGDLGWLTVAAATNQWPAEVAAAMFALRQPGEISPAIRSERGYYLLRLLAYEPKRPEPLEEARDRVAYELVRARSAEAEARFYARARSLHPVQVDTQRLHRLSAAVPVVAAAPPALPAR